VEIVNVETTAQMKEAVFNAVTNTDALIMAAAVADYQVAKIAKNKIKKEKGNLTLELVNTPDILTEVKGQFAKIGFAAESQDLLANARKKLEKKKLDLIVANEITGINSAFGSDTNSVILIGKDGTPENVPMMSKRAVADRILDRVHRILADRTHPVVHFKGRTNSAKS
jgi:phosphopantothenoylcysteine decarboxylase/phosphopantothenate--cysteine ligase